MLITCDLCRAEKAEAEERLADLEEDESAEGTSELQEARAAVATATYTYR